MTPLRIAVEIARPVALLLFIALGVWIVIQQRRGRSTRRAVIVFAAYAVAVTTATGVTQVDAWPFTTWALVHNMAQTKMFDWPIYGLDASGRAWRLDPRFMEPMPYEDFDSWLKTEFYKVGRPPQDYAACLLNPTRSVTAEQRRIAAFLLQRAETSRLRFLASGHAGSNDRWLGPLTAPYHFDRPPKWRTAADVPSSPFVALQIWDEQWDLEQYHRDPNRMTRRLIFDSRL